MCFVAVPKSLEYFFEIERTIDKDMDKDEDEGKRRTHTLFMPFSPASPDGSRSWCSLLSITLSN